MIRSPCRTPVVGGIAGDARAGHRERALLIRRQTGQDGNRVGYTRWRDSQPYKNSSKNPRLQEPARQRHVLRVKEHPAVWCQLHQVCGTGTPRPPFLPDQASEVEPCPPTCVPHLLESGSRGTYECSKVAAARFHLLRRRVLAGNRKCRAGRERASLLRQGRSDTRTGARQNEKAKCGWADFTSPGFHLEIPREEIPYRRKSSTQNCAPGYGLRAGADWFGTPPEPKIPGLKRKGERFESKRPPLSPEIRRCRNGQGS